MLIASSNRALEIKNVFNKLNYLKRELTLSENTLDENSRNFHKL
ncbi:hypothetical protein BN000_02961 [Neobacillus massiliamazoniensis]|uniref:Uncharacterized protein n=1 Tax=Neobacillus massiliamazoniensis TaxID=1499688 RepID=A0A0U1NYD8_9BACI|nr:hypothetical protein BN000_02961 [Neobacillus massiliamazoniensis]